MLQNSHEAYLNSSIHLVDHQNNCEKLFHDISIRSDKFKEFHGLQYESLETDLQR